MCLKPVSADMNTYIFAILQLLYSCYIIPIAYYVNPLAALAYIGLHVVVFEFAVWSAWRHATPAHRREKLTPIVYFGNWQHKITSISIPRCFMKIPDVYNTTSFGCAFKAVQVIIFHPSIPDIILVGKTSASKRKPYQFDIGAAGMVEAGECRLVALRREMKEEIGLDADKIDPDEKHVTPMMGYRSFLFVSRYVPTVAEYAKICNGEYTTDGTYEKVYWVKISTCLEELSAIGKDDTRPLLKHDTRMFLEAMVAAS